MDERIEAAEEQIAHLVRSVEDLSEVVARQAGEIAQLRRRVEMLLEREAEREADGVALIADQRPPHY
ncbi:SlyX protein [Cereibacter sphaeroides]|uniref:SlyX protein n=1 Tax=Cereibacter sphaeroides TaxID=1063 RepID=A0AAX1UEX9_CERSP|nr:SlyX family protein [Cereibacter sphaeroides]RHZ90785.1 SlyX protein [Cereibacter sphaeroides]